jgi:hypothetical protein
VNRRRTRRGWNSDKGGWRCASGNKGKQPRLWRKGLRAQGTKVSLSVKETNLTRGGVVKLGEGKSTGTLPKFKLLEAPTDGVIGK